MQNQQTKEKLAAALKTLLLEKPFERITIREIVGQCGMNRQTFYYHFNDIYDLLEWMYHQEMVSLLSPYQEPEDWKKNSLTLLNYIHENALICKRVLNSPGYKQLRRFVFMDFRALYRKFFDKMAFGHEFDEEFKTFLADFYAFGVEGYVIRWIEDGMKESPEQIAEQLAFFVEQNDIGRDSLQTPEQQP